MEHRKRSLNRVIADAAHREARCVKQPVGGDKTVTAAGTEIADRILLTAVNVDIRRAIGSQKQKVSATDGIVAATATEQGGPVEQTPCPDIVRVARLIDEFPGTKDQGLLAPHGFLPDRFAGLGMQRKCSIGFAGDQQFLISRAGQPVILSPHAHEVERGQNSRRFCLDRSPEFTPG